MAGSSGRVMLELISVSLTANREAILRNVSLTFVSGTPSAVLGLSRTGRTRLLRLLSGAERPLSGEVRLDGRGVRPNKPRAVQSAWIGRDGFAPSGRTVAKELAKAGGSQAAQAEFAGQFGLADKCEAKTKALGLEERLRLAIACAMAERASVILLDAPTDALAHQARERLLADLPSMFAGSKAIVVLAASATDEALAIAGQIVVLGLGEVIQAGPASEVLARPVTLRAAVATTDPRLNTLAAQIDLGACRLGDGSTFAAPHGLTMPSYGRCTLAFRPDDLFLDRPNNEALRFAVRADGEEVAGGRSYLRIRFAGETWLARQPDNTAAAAPGMMLNAFIDCGRIMVFDGEDRAVSPG